MRDEHEEVALSAEHDADPPLTGHRPDALDEPSRSGGSSHLFDTEAASKTLDEVGRVDRQLVQQAMRGQHDETGLVHVHEKGKHIVERLFAAVAAGLGTALIAVTQR